VSTVLIGAEAREAGGLVVVGSHVDLTNRQLASLQRSRPDMLDIELAVDRRDEPGYLEDIVASIIDELQTGDVIVRTSRALQTGSDPDESLRIARAVSAAVSGIVHAVASAVRPRFVIAKGGITSNDVASEGLDIRRGTIRGPLLPGLVSLWQPAEGLAADIPYVVFPGNVGDDDALLTVVNKLSLHN
jgi:uncharacterized protein YgbK (DUF1537 family)